ncbi:histone methyltransferase set2 [Serendipita sp. 401]|nr:histone methyltransferase set2 [Serendipita sp. 398]KAG8827341.1 histone methyltransferase set2 [Serendipita sp. 401]
MEQPNSLRTGVDSWTGKGSPTEPTSFTTNSTGLMNSRIPYSSLGDSKEPRSSSGSRHDSNDMSDSTSTGSQSDSDVERSHEESGSAESVVNIRPAASIAKHGGRSKKPAKAPVQLIPHCPIAKEEALGTFETLDTNWHQYKYLGKSKLQEDAMTCECSYKPGDPVDRACGPKSDCINRLTQVECLDGECRCQAFCQNQRFQKREYANVDIVKTEMKGYGLRAASPLKRDDFIYEYIGEVVSEPSFLKRMRDYGDEGIEHFYFMMLQKDEFIDATKKGGIGRFVNHSCNPNCYVARWVVGSRLRMGIFAKRDIQMHEELTFNYNVDRYGHEAQKCFCGEPNCIGFIGGKTQTDLGGMDDLFIDALGIADEVDRLGLKGNRKKKGKKLDEDFTPTLTPMVEEDVPKVVNALRQTTSRSILTKLLDRIKMTEDPTVLRQVTRLRGLTQMTPVLAEYKEDDEVKILVLETVKLWPFVNRTKIEDAKIEPLLSELVHSHNHLIAGLAEGLLSQWSTLETIYRIPKKARRDEEEDMISKVVFQVSHEDYIERPSKRIRKEEPHLSIKPLGVFRGSAPVGPISKSENIINTTAAVTSITPSSHPSKGNLTQIIEQALEDARKAQAEEEARVAAATVEEQRVKEERALKKQKAKGKVDRSTRQNGSEPTNSNGSLPKNTPFPAEPSNKEKRLLKLITQKIAELEKKGSTYQSNAKLETLSDEKRAKIKSYVKSYVGRLDLPALPAIRDPRRPEGASLTHNPRHKGTTNGSNDATSDNSSTADEANNGMDIDRD